MHLYILIVKAKQFFFWSVHKLIHLNQLQTKQTPWNEIGALWLLVHDYELWGNLVYKLTE